MRRRWKDRGPWRTRPRAGGRGPGLRLGNGRRGKLAANPRTQQAWKRAIPPLPARLGAALRRIARLCYPLSIAVLAFLLGAMAVLNQWPPFRTLVEARLAGRTLLGVAVREIAAWRGGEAAPRPAGTQVLDRAAMSPGLTAVFRDDGEAWVGLVIDADGRVLHRWRARFAEVFPQAPHIRERFREPLWHGVHVYPDGDLLFNFGGGQVPFGGGAARITADGGVRWRLARNTHHDLQVTPGGDALILGHELKDAAALPESCTRLLDFPMAYYEDVVYRVGPAGEVVETVSILRALCRSRFRGLLSATMEDATLDIRTNVWRSEYGTNLDPLHTNSIQEIGPALARRAPWAQAGDWLLSLRNLNAVVLLDPRSKRVEWALSGAFVRQHDADLQPDGSLLVFDNRSLAGGKARVVRLDPVTQREIWSFAGTPQRPMRSLRTSNQQGLPNGNVLIVEAEGGTVHEVAPTADGGAVPVWRYEAPKGADGRAMLITNAVRLPPGYFTPAFRARMGVDAGRPARPDTAFKRKSN